MRRGHGGQRVGEGARSENGDRVEGAKGKLERETKVRACAHQRLSPWSAPNEREQPGEGASKARPAAARATAGPDVVSTASWTRKATRARRLPPGSPDPAGKPGSAIERGAQPEARHRLPRDRSRPTSRSRAMPRARAGLLRKAEDDDARADSTATIARRDRETKRAPSPPRRRRQQGTPHPHRATRASPRDRAADRCRQPGREARALRPKAGTRADRVRWARILSQDLARENRRGRPLLVTAE